MDDNFRRHTPRHPSSHHGYRSVDGFIPNRRGRVIKPGFSRLPETGSLQTDNKVIGDTKEAQTLAKVPAHHHAETHAPGVTWAPNHPAPVGLDEPKKLSKRRRRQGKRRFGWLPSKRVVFRSSLAVLAVILIVGGYVGYKFAKNIDKVFGGNLASNIASLLGTTKLKGEDNGRVNILLAGDSADDPNHGGAQLTDSIMLVSIDTQNNTGFMLSIPRDLWVNIPTLGHQKINAANDVTSFNQAGYPKGGMGQLEQVVTQDLGIPVDYYALIDYTAFKDAVNAVGGITINIQSTDPRGLFDPNISKADGGPLKLPNGWDKLNGQTALNLARARGDPCYCGEYEYGFPNSDFDRTQHQRQMLVALEQKASSAGVLSNPIRVGQLFDAIGNDVQTDLTLADVLRLVHLAKAANLNNVQSVTYPYGTLEPNQKAILTGYLTPDGEDALVPVAGIDNFTQLQLYYQKLSSSNPVIKEGANVVILNGGNITGLAKQYQDQLISKGVNVSSTGNAGSVFGQTEIMDNSGGKMPQTLQLLESIFGSNVVANNAAINSSNANFVVILGNNQGPPASSQ